MRRPRPLAAAPLLLALLHPPGAAAQEGGALPAPFLFPVPGPGADAANGVRRARDGDLVIAGYARGPRGDAEMLLVRADPAGRPRWTRRYGEGGDDLGWVARELPDGGFALLGWGASARTSSEDAVLVRTDAAGNPLWRRTYGGPENQRATDLAVLPDGGMVFVEQTGEPAGCIPSSSGRPPCADIRSAVVRVDADGEELWRTGVAGPGIDRLFYVGVDGTGRIVAMGLATRAPGADLDVLAVALDAGGGLLWARRYGGAGDDVGHALLVYPDGEAVLGGYGSTGAAGPNDGFAIRVGVDGEPVRCTRFGGGGDDRVIAMAPAADGGYVATGYTRSFGAAGWDAYLAKLDAADRLEWLRAYAAPADQAGNAAVEVPGGWVVAGYGDVGGERGRELLLLAVDPQGIAGSGTAPSPADPVGEGCSLSAR
ncbi:MAG TPA: hypothetical protein VHG51_11170 [Longimicrobiaceae bacterium]|nr:hypothetical protein [Longimicrobiaceae bacterium]